MRGVVPDWVARGDPPALHALRPDAVVCVDPEPADAETLAGLDAVRVGYALARPWTEPLPPWLDRLVVAAPPVEPPAWRLLPPPVPDDLLAARPSPADGGDVVAPDDLLAARPSPADGGDVVAPGAAAARRDELLAPLVAEGKVRRVEALSPADLAGLAAVVHVAAGRPPAPVPELSLWLAAGLLVVAEPLVAGLGLEPGLDHVEVASRAELALVLATLGEAPETYAGVRRRGRAKAERLRATRAWPDLIRDLRRDVVAFGRRHPA